MPYNLIGYFWKKIEKVTKNAGGSALQTPIGLRPRLD